MICDDIRVRRVGRGDGPALEHFYAGLTPDSRASRFHGGCRGITRGQAERLAAVDHEHREGFVAVAAHRIVGHLVLEPTSAGTDELALAVDDRVQHQGVGTLLVAAAVASARLRHVRRLVAWVKSDNVAMRHLLVGSHRPLHVTWEGPVARYLLELPVDLPRPLAA